MTQEQLRLELERLKYPCYLVVHGAARDYRTKYRSEHHGVFTSGMVGNGDEALRMIDGAKYPGLYSEMDLIAISADPEEDGGLREDVL